MANFEEIFRGRYVGNVAGNIAGNMGKHVMTKISLDLAGFISHNRPLFLLFC